MAPVAERAIAGWNWPDVEVISVREEAPLGTGGAVRFAASAAAPHADPLVVLNGDSFLAAALGGVWRLLEDPETDGVVIGVEARDTARFGRLRMDGDSFLKAFEEKQPGAGWINAGIYILRRRLLSLFPRHSPLSMEYDVFPALLTHGCRLKVFRTAGDFIDIGTPEALAGAESFMRRHAGKLSE
jgi:NDP-sugar pyrophosphorylase family protein